LRKLSVAVLFGGVSSEYSVSLRSARFILENLDRDRFEPLAVGITRDGRWYLYDGPIDRIENDSWHKDNAHLIHAAITPDRGLKSLVALDGSGMFIPVDVAFPAVHGQNCEDGALQGLFKLAGIPCVGSGVTASALCMDKEFTHIIMERAGIDMAPYLCVRRRDMEDMDALCRRVADTLGYPVFVKPANSGSSVGGSQVRKPEELHKALLTAFDEDHKALIEALIVGQEVECAVFGGDDLIAPLVGEIVAPDGFYDYESKYLNDNASLHIPARIPAAAAERVRRTAIKVFETAGCRGLARVDFFYCPEGNRVVFNEINTLPGFTSISMYPKLLAASGLSGRALVSGLIDICLEDARG
jgi:D-alanine-D-alanine ligase